MAVPVGIVTYGIMFNIINDVTQNVTPLLKEMGVPEENHNNTVGITSLGVFGLLALIGLSSGLPRFFGAAGDIGAARRELRKIKKEIRQLINQIPRDIPTYDQMREFVRSRLGHLEDRAKQYLRLDETNITIEVAIPPIQEWAYLQPSDKPGYGILNRETQEHLRAVHAKEGTEPIYAAYYIQYLFPTQDYIVVLGEFFDVISDDTRGKVTDEYYYADVTSIRTEVSEREVYFSNRIQEAVKLELTVASGNTVTVCMFDERIQRSLNEYLEDQRKSNIEKLTALQSSLLNASDAERKAIKEELAEAKAARQRVLQSDRASLAENVVRDVRHQLRIKKGTEPTS